MSLTKLLVLLMGLVAVAFAAKYALTGTMGDTDPAKESRPKRQLDNVRSRAKELEREQQQKADDFVKKSDEQAK
jgi:Ni/Co efflux regulator RcnB